MTSAWLDFLGFSDKDASQHLHSGCILYIFMYTAEREGRGGGVQRMFFKGGKICHTPPHQTEFFYTPPSLLTKKKNDNPTSLIEESKIWAIL